jgi:signal peptidase II
MRDALSPLRDNNRTILKRSSSGNVMADVPRNRYLLFTLIAALGFAVDLLTKAWVFSWPELYDFNAVHWIWPTHVGIQLSWNEGALFGLGQGNVWLFAALSVAAAVAIPAWLFGGGGARDLLLTIALGGIMAGILGNLYDRLGLADNLWPGRIVEVNQPVHAVRDWILWQWNDRWRWPNFNVADSLLVISAAMLIWHAQRRHDASMARSETKRNEQDLG